ncbi:hypothetical protein JOC34_002690 [Virgibacillus halotolerans]|nr:hypothetical protein [Virgibacillus halotolerans]
MRPNWVSCLTASEIHFAFRGLALSLRRTGSASADVAIGRGVLSLPRKERCGVSSSSLFPQESSCISYAVTIAMCYQLLYCSLGMLTVAAGSRLQRDKQQVFMVGRVSAVPAENPAGSGFCFRGS